MDRGTIGGLLFGLLLIASAILMGGNVGMYVDLPAALIVFGGTIATTFIRFNLEDILNAFKIAAKAFTLRTTTIDDLVKEILALSNFTRKEGILQMEHFVIHDPFLKRAALMCADGHSADFIKYTLETEIDMTLERHTVGRNIFIAMGEASPAFGMLGTLVGLVSMMANLHDPSKVGPGLAVALLTTLYGALLAHLIFLPIADKLKRRSLEEEIHKRMVMDGILCIQKGLNTRLVQDVLNNYLPTMQRKSF